ncbi:MAG: hypothetical protein WC346_22370 [Methanogenium sp.]|jgi:hypothetical protein
MNREQLCRFHTILAFLDQERIIVDKKREKLKNLIKEYSPSKECLELQDFIGEYLKLDFAWMTSLGVIDATDILIKSAKGNGNI